MKKSMAIAAATPEVSFEIFDGTVDSREIARITGKSHANICRDIRKMLDALGIPRIRFELGYLDAQGQQRTCYRLPKRECLLLTSGYDVKLRAAIIDRWAELETQAQRGRNPIPTPSGTQIQALEDRLERLEQHVLPVPQHREEFVLLVNGPQELYGFAAIAWVVEHRVRPGEYGGLEIGMIEISRELRFDPDHYKGTINKKAEILEAMNALGFHSKIVPAGWTKFYRETRYPFNKGIES
jgi:phage regulator Rha-like protein